MKTKLLVTLSVVVLAHCSTHAAINWIGGSSSDFWDDANWDFSGSTYNASTFNALTTISDDIFLVNATGITVAADNGIRVGNGYRLTLNASDLLVNGTSSNSGINGVDDDTAVNPSTGVYSFIYLNNGAFLNTQFTSLGLNVNVDGTSHIQFRGSGDPINGQSERTIVNLFTGARLTLPTLAEFTEQATTQNSDILIEGFSFGANNALLSFSGTGPVTGVAVIPEPSAVLLGGLGLLGMLCRSRNK